MAGACSHDCALRLESDYRLVPASAIAYRVGALLWMTLPHMTQMSLTEVLQCRRCSAPLKGREGKFILKYFLIGRGRTQAKAARAGYLGSGKTEVGADW